MKFEIEGYIELDKYNKMKELFKKNNFKKYSICKTTVININ